MCELDTPRHVYEWLQSEYVADDANSVLKQTKLVEWLEYVIKSQFKDTEDFHHKMSRFLGLMETDGDRLKNARKRKGWTQEWLADYCGVSRSYLADMERGKRVLNNKAGEFICRQDTLDYAEPEFCDKSGLRREGETTIKNKVRGH